MCHFSTKFCENQSSGFCNPANKQTYVDENTNLLDEVTKPKEARISSHPVLHHVELMLVVHLYRMQWLDSVPSSRLLSRIRSLSTRKFVSSNVVVFVLHGFQCRRSTTASTRYFFHSLSLCSTDLL